MIRTGIDITDTMTTTVTPNAVQLLERNGDSLSLYGSPEALKALAIKILEYHSSYGKEVAVKEAQEALNDELDKAAERKTA